MVYFFLFWMLSPKKRLKLILFIFIYLWLCWVLLPYRLLSGCGVFSCGAWALGHASFSSWGSRALGLGLSCFEACGIFPDQGVNPYLLHWQADFFLPLGHQGNPEKICFLKKLYVYLLFLLPVWGQPKKLPRRLATEARFAMLINKNCFSTRRLRLFLSILG